jgi:hypothetical protein
VTAALALLGAGLLVVVAAQYRLDRTLCASWPKLATGFAYAAIYAVAVVALGLAWRNARQASLPLVVHAIALCAAPFLSSDPLMYAALGRALAHGAAATTSLTQALGANDAFLIPLPEAWRTGTSAYGPLWNALARVLGALAGDDLGLALRLHQLCAAIAVLAGAWIASRTVSDKRAAFIAVALCPLAVIEATVGAHNDALLVPLTALALLAWIRGRRAFMIIALAAGLAIKASAAIFLFPVLLAMFLYTLPSDRTRRAAAIAIALGASLALFALPLLADGPLDAVSRLVERPGVPFDHCTRSLECLPRVLFRFVLHAPRAAWATGIVFRAVGIAWFAFIALRAAESARDDRTAPVRWLAYGLFFYFFLLHGWAQSWYLLPLLPVLPLLEGDRYAPPIRLYLVTAVLYYALVLPVSCFGATPLTAVADLIEASITVFPPVVLLLRRRALPR